MTDAKGSHPHAEQTPLGSHRPGQAPNIVDEQQPSHSKATQVDLGPPAEAHEEAVKDQIDGAIASGPKKADQSTGGRVLVGETGDLRDLAARRQSQYSQRR
ncbi:hypothetical protein SAMD00023353_3500600 [Rosellinia necatrix]|uniref:Uncharacterized protein n=1 Tax=Rosellinia necatrix TaxID=77044 RepID=A0A1W2TMS8_ROSNE|nr:hypothetical protein SAMD00023353_3500600 [Rosellinia necatrix]